MSFRRPTLGPVPRYRISEIQFPATTYFRRIIERYSVGSLYVMFGIERTLKIIVRKYRTINASDFEQIYILL